MARPRSRRIPQPLMSSSKVTPPRSAWTNGALPSQRSVPWPAFPFQVTLQKAAEELAFPYHLHIAGKKQPMFY